MKRDIPFKVLILCLFQPKEQCLEVIRETVKNPVKRFFALTRCIVVFVTIGSDFWKLIIQRFKV